MLFKFNSLKTLRVWFAPMLEISQIKFTSRNHTLHTYLPTYLPNTPYQTLPQSGVSQGSVRIWRLGFGDLQGLVVKWWFHVNVISNLRNSNTLLKLWLNRSSPSGDSIWQNRSGIKGCLLILLLPLTLHMLFSC